MILHSTFLICKLSRHILEENYKYSIETLLDHAKKMVKLENMHNEEKEAVEQLRLRLKDNLPLDKYEDDVLFYRFLAARNMDIDKAEAMLRKHLMYRKIYQMDTLLQDFTPKDVFLKYIGANILGPDKEGNLVIYFAVGQISVPDIAKCYKYDNFLKHLFWSVEYYTSQLKELNLKTGKICWKFTYVVNVDKLSWATICNPLTAKLLVFIAEKYQDNCPETLNAVCFINCPAFYIVAYAIVRKMLDPKVVQKLKFFGRSGWQEEIAKLIDADVLPAFLGGCRTDPDGNPMCNTVVSHGGRVPEKYYLSRENRTFKDKSQVETATIYPGTTYEVFAEVKIHGSILKWEFEVPKSDVGFGLFMKVSEQERNEIIPVHRIETVNETASDSYRCRCAGTYVILFDNTYSWLNTKYVSYCITVFNPGE